MKDNIRNWIEQDGKKFLEEVGIKKGQTVLDFGSGEGHYAIPASKIIGANVKVYAVDKDINVLNKLKRNLEEKKITNIELINKETKIPLGEDSVDVALAYDVIHYGNKKKRIVIYNEIHRILKQEGLFSVYPKHRKDDCPLDELAGLELADIIKEIEESGFALEFQYFKTLLHDDYYNRGCILNFRKSHGLRQKNKNENYGDF